VTEGSNSGRTNRYVEDIPATSYGMGQRAVAVLMVALMGLTGCFGFLDGSTSEDQEEETNEPLSIEANWTLTGPQAAAAPGEVVTFVLEGVEQRHKTLLHVGALEVVRDDGVLIDVEQAFVWSTPPTFALEAPSTGTYAVFLEVQPATGVSLSNGSAVQLSVTFSVRQDGLRLLTPSSIPVEDGMLSLQGTIRPDPQRPLSDLSRVRCTVSVNLGEERGSVGLNVEEGLSFVLTTSADDVEPHILVRSVCVGPIDSVVLESVVNVLNTAEDSDEDGDGVDDAIDGCPNGAGSSQGWASTPASDKDRDGCRDVDEDTDDDNDGVPDSADGCPSVVGWMSNVTTDHDADGCDDLGVDDDDDNDGVEDSGDLCPQGSTSWTSHASSDWDADGCRDVDEDDDDDQDGLMDDLDACPAGQSWWSPSAANDWDMDGCRDADEDEDDDNDGILDVHLNGTVADLCAMTPRNETVDANGCGPSQRDVDQDGVTDDVDLCPFTELGFDVDVVGCEDRDGDGVHRSQDECPDSPDRWSIDASGCAVVQQPIDWTSSTDLTGPMQTVPDFTVATLNGTLTFSDLWDGRSTYMFLIMKTTSQGSTSSTFTMNPGNLIRSLPDDVHLVYGSFDSSYHQQVVDRQTDVERRLTPSEQNAWASRIHYIDMDLSSASGGLSDALTSLSEPAGFGIDRFQRLRQIGSTYTWNTASSSYDPLHYAHEAWMWATEFPVEQRRFDPGVEAIDLMFNAQHQGGWGGGFTSSMNATFDLQHDLSTYDTMEVFHEHACSERRDRYQTTSGTYAGCHEWDYEANLMICERNNTSSCGTEFTRWITTYGREGRWLTNLSPYLFMLEDNDDRRFLYKGANGGGLTITLLFSRWSEANDGHRPDTATFGFTGGQFNGSYNDPNLYDRERTLVVPSNASRVQIVATITGHGFQVDNANCAEFCDHEHHFTIGEHTDYEWHPIVYSSTGCEDSVHQGVVANQFGSWPYGRAGWCAGMDVKQWTLDITSWVTPGDTATLSYRGLFNGAEYEPTGETSQAGRRIHAEIWVVYDVPLPSRS